MTLHEFAIDTTFGRVAGLRSTPGRGPNVLALHGWLDNGASFVPLAAQLPALDLVAPDLPGHGASAHLPASAEYTVVNAARAGFAIADALGWQRFALLGHSLGGAVASVMAAAQPQRIERLLLIETLGALAEDEQRTARRLRDSFAQGASSTDKRLRVFTDVAAAVRARLQANDLSEPVARLLVERGIGPVRLDQHAGGFIWRSDPRLARATAVRMTEAQIRDLIGAIDCPTRVILAEPAQPYFPDVLRRQRMARLRDGELIVVDGSHHLHMEDPAGVAAAIGDFFAPDGCRR